MAEDNNTKIVNYADGTPNELEVRGKIVTLLSFIYLTYTLYFWIASLCTDDNVMFCKLQ